MLLQTSKFEKISPISQKCPILYRILIQLKELGWTWFSWGWLLGISLVPIFAQKMPPRAAIAGTPKLPTLDPRGTIGYQNATPGQTRYTNCNPLPKNAPDETCTSSFTSICTSRCTSRSTSTSTSTPIEQQELDYLRYFDMV